MGDIRSIHLRALQGRLGDIVYQLTRVELSLLHRGETWSPAINAYRCRDGFVICVELAGVGRSSIDLRVEPNGGWWCFEVNTAPGFIWFENQTGLPIAAAVARALTG